MSHQEDEVQEKLYSDESDSEDNVIKTKKKKSKKKAKPVEEVDTEYSDYDLFDDEDVAKAQNEFLSNGISVLVSMATSNVAKSTETSSSNLSTPDSSPITQSPVVEATYEVISSKSNKSSKIVIEKLLASDISIKPKNTEICSECGTTKMRNRYLYCPNKQCSTRIKKK